MGDLGLFICIDITDIIDFIPSILHLFYIFISFFSCFSWLIKLLFIPSFPGEFTVFFYSIKLLLLLPSSHYYSPTSIYYLKSKYDFTNMVHCFPSIDSPSVLRLFCLSKMWPLEYFYSPFMPFHPWFLGFYQTT